MNQRLKVMITREGWYYLGMLTFIIAGAVIRDINLLYIMAGMMLGPLLFSFYVSIKSLRRIHVSRNFQSLIGVGDPLYIEVAISKSAGTSRAFAVIVHDQVRRIGRGRRLAADAKLFFPQVTPGETEEASYRVCLQRRGKYRLGPMKVTTSMPIGLVRATASGISNDVVLASPRLGRLLPTWMRHLELKSDGGQKSRRRRGQAEGDFYGMREWRNGDSRSWIHWRTSAKQNQLTVRQFEQRINQDLVIVLDLFQPTRSSQPRREIEDAVSFAATLVVEQTRHGSTHLLVASASEAEFLLQGTSSPVLRRELLERFAVVQPTREDYLPEVLRTVLQQASANSKIILVSACERDLQDTDLFEAIWRRTDIRRTITDIVKVNTSAPEFRNVFRLADADSRRDHHDDRVETEPAEVAAS